MAAGEETLVSGIRQQRVCRGQRAGLGKVWVSHNRKSLYSGLNTKGLFSRVKELELDNPRLV